MNIKIKKADIIFVCILVAIILISIVPILSNSSLTENSEVLIYINGELEIQHPLNSNTEITLDNIGTVIIQDGYVHMENSYCKDSLCEHFGKISKPYQSIICLPNKTIIKISAVDNEFDDVSG